MSRQTSTDMGSENDEPGSAGFPVFWGKVILTLEVTRCCSGSSNHEVDGISHWAGCALNLLGLPGDDV